MALDFPTAPSVGQTYSGPGGIVWQFDGTKWMNGAPGSGAGVTSFNTRTGPVTLLTADVTGAGGAAQSSLASYLPLAGGPLTGPLTSNSTAAFTSNITGAGITSLTGNVITQATGAGNANFACFNNAGATMGVFYWNASANSLTMQNFSGTGGALQITNTGAVGSSGALTSGTTFVAGTTIYASTGYLGKAGSSGAQGGNLWNMYWTGTQMQLWVDASNLGNITVTSDYRIKRDVAPLGTMWDAVKALRPVSYRHQDYTLPTAPIREDGTAGPLIVGDDVERWGFIAHELQEALIPDAATGVKDQADCIQSPNPWTVLASVTKALQEAIARIEALEDTGAGA